MGRFSYFTACSLDGFIADQNHSLQWLFDVPGGEEDSPIEDFVAGCGALVMGARTYRWILEHESVLEAPERWSRWYGDRPTWVFTHRDLPVVPGARITFVSGPVDESAAAIAAGAGSRAVWLVGGGELVGSFDDEGLLDEIRLGIVPVSLGGGAPVLPRRITSERLTLRDAVRRGQRLDVIYDVTR